MREFHCSEARSSPLSEVLFITTESILVIAIIISDRLRWVILGATSRISISL